MGNKNAKSARETTLKRKKKRKEKEKKENAENGGEKGETLTYTISEQDQGIRLNFVVQRRFFICYKTCF